jgi:hypothetical protein
MGTLLLFLGALDAAAALAAGDAGAVGIGGFVVGRGGHPQRWSSDGRLYGSGQGERYRWDIHPQSWGNGGRRRQ